MNSVKKYSALITLCSTLLLGSSAFAHITYVTSEDDRHINIENLHNQEEARYQVNGKTFTWSDLTKEQQARLAPIQAKLKALEEKVSVDEKAIQEAVAAIEVKAKELELEVHKIEQATVKVEKGTLSLKEVAELSRTLAQKTRVNEQVIKEKARELRKLEVALPRIDKSKLEEISEHADELEDVLVEIAETMD